MKNSTVIIIQQNDYNENKIYEKLKSAILYLGGLENLIKINGNILVKPNFLTTADADSGIVTHPAVIRAVLHLLKDAGCPNVKYGDSPGHGSCKNAAEKIGLLLENTYGATLAPMDEEVLTAFPNGATAKEFYFAKEITEADSIINLCKMKTHALENITGAVKNVYGFICGKRKAAGHIKYANATIFARMLADIHRCKAPALNIMDGIVAMEGNGPGSGNPTSMGLLLVSTDPVAMDTVFSNLIYFDPEQVPTCVQGEKLGIGTMDKTKIRLLLLEDSLTCDKSDTNLTAAREISADELVAKFGKPDFDIIRNEKGKNWLAKYANIMTHLQRKPVIDSDKCIRCGVCVEHCPVPGKALSFSQGKDRPPVYDYKKCIRCYCCQEMCPKHAIKVNRKIPN